MTPIRPMAGFRRAVIAWAASVVPLLFASPAPGAEGAAAAEPKLRLDPRVQAMPSNKMGPFIRLEDGGILTVDGTSAFISKDEGATWSAPGPMFPADQPFQISNERSILLTKDGTVVVAFMNLKTRSKGYWDEKTKGFVPDVRLDVWTVRSVDGGKTWSDAQLVQRGYAGAVRALVQAANGNLVLATQDVLRDPARHVVTAYSSSDEGKTWKQASWVDKAGERHPSLDLGGHGHHDGAVEPTVARLTDGKLWMLIRTAKDCFWQAYSTDNGATWTDFDASPIAASAAPAMLTRLASGRLLMAWNQLYPEGKTSYSRNGPDWHETPASYHREELSLALSDDDGKTWSKPVVIARQPGKWLSYPYVFERKPGELWVTTMQGGLRLLVHESDILAGPKPKGPEDGPEQAQGGTRASDPESIGPVSVGANLVTLPDGTWDAYRAINQKGTYKLVKTRSSDRGRTWSPQEVLRDLPGEPWGGAIALRDRRGEIQLFFLRLRVEGAGRRIAVDRCIDIWHLHSLEKGTKWSEPRRIFEGYTGSVQMALQLSSGRIILPFGSWVAGRLSAPPTGSNFCTTVYSDDDGETWTQSPAQLTAPCHEGFNGNNYGACEPVIVERNDGQVWMLMRSQDGFLYESFSNDGAAWSTAKPSRFHSSSSPAAIAKLGDGRLVVAWNNCEMPPRVDRQGVYGGRDALHLAISDPQGQTWRGYREIYLDAKRYETPPKSGDRGTAYPFQVVTKEGRIGVISGQGAGRRALTLVDPSWLLETSRADDFSQGLAAWSVFTEFGPARGYWRDRVPGASLVDHPDKPKASVLHLRRSTEERPADGAVWNLPAGRRGKLTLRLRLENGFGGGSIALGDRFFNPTDDQGESKAVFRLPIDPTGRLGDGSTLKSGRWATLGLDWDLAVGQCKVSLDGREATTLPLANQADEGGISYLRLRSQAAKEDPAGFLVESVAATTERE